MAGFVPGRDRMTIEALHPDETRRLRTIESEDRRVTLDKEELAELDREQTRGAVPHSRRSLLDRLMRRW